MKKVNGALYFSPTDLVNFWESQFASWMDRYYLENPECEIEQDEDDALKAILKQCGDSHEKATLAAFQAAGKRVAEINTKSGDLGRAQTIAAMKEGYDVIFQGRLEKGEFGGFADFLVKCEGSSKLGSHYYEAWDTKLAASLKPYYVLQLCMYSEMLEEIQGVLPSTMIVVLGTGKKEPLKVKDYYFYYQAVKENFLKFHLAFDSANAPDPEKYRSYGVWNTYAEKLLSERDSLSSVARISNNQIKNLQAVGIKTMADLAKTKKTSVPKMHPEVLARLKKQCQLQVEILSIVVDEARSLGGNDFFLYSINEHKSSVNHIG